MRSGGRNEDLTQRRRVPRRRLTYLRKSRGGQDARWQPRDFCLYLRPSSELRTGEGLRESPRSTWTDVRVLSLAKAWICFRGRNYGLREVKGEIDLVGYGGETLVFVVVRADAEAREVSGVNVTAEKQHLIGRTAPRFLTEGHVKECPVLFEVAIEECSGQASGTPVQECF
jgi:Holliday junction resolvase-like predicted endonuclease